MYCRACKQRSQDDSHGVSVCPSGMLIPAGPIIIRGPRSNQGHHVQRIQMQYEQFEQMQTIALLALRACELNPALW